jgi:hypothetical protein
MCVCMLCGWRDTTVCEVAYEPGYIYSGAVYPMGRRAERATVLQYCCVLGESMHGVNVSTLPSRWCLSRQLKPPPRKAASIQTAPHNPIRVARSRDSGILRSVYFIQRRTRVCTSDAGHDRNRRLRQQARFEARQCRRGRRLQGGCAEQDMMV